MRTLVTHIVLTLVAGYIFFTNTVVAATALNGILVFSVFFFLLWLTSFTYRVSYSRKLPKLTWLLLYLLKEFVVANLRVAHDILSRSYNMQPTLIALPLDARSDLELTVLSNVISLTPGTLSIDLSPDRRILYIHALYIPEGGTEALKQEIKRGYEKRIIELLA